MAKKILVFVAAIMALGVVPAVASATNSPELIEPTAGGVHHRLSNGALIEATNVGATVMKNAAGETLVSCEKATMTGKVTVNDGSNIEGDISAASFENTSSVDCSGILGATRVTTNPATNGLPWCIRSTSSMLTDEFQVRGNSCDKAARAIRFVLDVTAFGITCTYQRASAIPGTLTTSTSTSTLSISGVQFTLLEGGFGCPSEGLLSMKFELETDETSIPVSIL